MEFRNRQPWTWHCYVEGPEPGEKFAHQQLTTNQPLVILFSHDGWINHRNITGHWFQMKPSIHIFLIWMILFIYTLLPDVWPRAYFIMSFVCRLLCDGALPCKKENFEPLWNKVVIFGAQVVKPVWMLPWVFATISAALKDQSVGSEMKVSIISDLKVILQSKDTGEYIVIMDVIKLSI